MIGKGAREIRPVTLAEVEKILEQRQGTSGEFGFEQQTSLDYAKKFAHLKLSDATSMKEELEALELKPETAVKIVDLLPKNKSQLLLIISKDRADYPEKKLGEIEEIIAKFSKKAKKIEIKKEEPVAAEAAPAEAPAEEKKEAKDEKAPKEEKAAKEEKKEKPEKKDKKE